MAKMVELLAALKQRVLTLLTEWEDHPGLLKVVDVIEMLLAIPLSTPLAKVGEIVNAELFVMLVELYGLCHVHLFPLFLFVSVYF